MIFLEKLPDVNELHDKYSLTNEQKNKRNDYLNQIQNVLSGQDTRKILIIGPCSADREDAVLDYCNRLAKLSEKVKNVFVVIPRVYTSKPRTNGTGYKGLLHDPNLSGKPDNLLSGIEAVRRIHLRVIQETGMYGADEMLYPESMYYISDLLSYAAVGARSVEDQAHRMTASGINVPVGMKNPTSGSVEVMLNSILAAQKKHRMIYRGWEVETEGNAYAHGIMRGYVDTTGKNHPNYHYEELCDCYDEYIKKNLKNMGVIIDCNHSNSGKRYDEQIRIANDVAHTCRQHAPINNFVKGLMIESYIEDGNQLYGGQVYGKSITDACLGWNKTEKLILTLADKL